MKCPRCGQENEKHTAWCAQGQTKLGPPRPAPPSKPLPEPARKPPSPASEASKKKKHYLSQLGLPPREIVPGRTLTFGRAGTSTFPIHSEKVSRSHAVLRWEGEQAFIVDVGSHNGTFVDGVRVKEHRLASGNEIKIGPFVAIYRYGAPEDLNAEAKKDVRNSKTLGQKDPVFTGKIERTGLAEVLQGLEQNSKTGTLVVYARSLFGWVTVHEGTPGVAELGTKRDEKAVMELLDLEEGHFVFEPELRSPEKNMAMSVTALLLEWSRHRDERGTRRLEETHDD